MGLLLLKREHYTISYKTESESTKSSLITHYEEVRKAKYLIEGAPVPSSGKGIQEEALSPGEKKRRGFYINWGLHIGGSRAVILAKATKYQARVLRHTLCEFSNISGQRVSLSKSQNGKLDGALNVRKGFGRADSLSVFASSFPQKHSSISRKYLSSPQKERTGTGDSRKQPICLLAFSSVPVSILA
ncbi:hypothetical protein ACFE04_019662 [Oxalis oulophora]